MAEKINPPAAVDSAVGDVPDDSLEAMNPNRTLAVGDREVTVREYTFWEGMEVAHGLQPMIDAMAELYQPNQWTYARLRRVLGAHHQQVIPAIALSIGQDEAWIRGLDGVQSEILLSAWFKVHMGFFVGEVMMQAAERSMAIESPLTGLSSSPDFPPPDLEASPNSSSSPSVN